MTKEKRMEPPRLSLVPSSQESHDQAREDAADEPVRANALPRNVAALPSADRREKLRILEALLFAASEPLDEAKLAAHLAEWHAAGACDGFDILPAVTAIDLALLAQAVVPLLRARRLRPVGYAGTLREQLQLARPLSRFAA